MFELLCRLQAISSFAKDCHYNFQEYSQHLLADVNQDDLQDYMDLINEVCYLGKGEEAPSSQKVMAGAIDYIPTPSENDRENFAKLKLLIKETLVYIQSIETQTRGDNALLDNIAMTLQQLHGLLFKEVDDAKDMEYLNSIPDLIEEENYNSEEDDKIAYVMKEFAEGKLKTPDGKVVTDKDQALAIAYSEARKKKLTNESEEKDWITVNGNHIPVKDGQTPKEAVKEFIEEHQENLDKSKKYNIVGIKLPKEEYGKVTHELNNNLSKEEKSKKYITRYIDDYVYTVVNNGFNEYTIISKEKINGID